MTELLHGRRSVTMEFTYGICIYLQFPSEVWQSRKDKVLNGRLLSVMQEPTAEAY